MLTCITILFQLRSAAVTQLAHSQRPGLSAPGHQRMWRHCSGLSVSKETLPKSGVFYKSIFAVKGSHRHLSTGSLALHLVPARAWRAPSESEFGWVQMRLECLHGYCVSFLPSSPLSWYFFPPKDTVYWARLPLVIPQTKIQIQFFKTDEWGLVLHFCFPQLWTACTNKNECIHLFLKTSYKSSVTLSVWNIHTLTPNYSWEHNHSTSTFSSDSFWIHTSRRRKWEKQSTLWRKELLNEGIGGKILLFQTNLNACAAGSVI